MEREIFWPSAKELARRFGVHPTTARRWRREQNAPEAVMQLLAGDLGMFSKKWRGWIIRHDLLISPEDLQAKPGDVRALHFMRMQIVTYQTENRKLEEALKTAAPQMDDQPLPESWDWQELTG